MKSLIPLLAFLLAVFSASAQTIPNASFENWHPYSLGEYPDSWTSSDSVAVALGGGASVFKGTDPYDGTLSIHMKSVNTSFGIKGPGVATNGIVSLSGSTFIFSGGSPDTARSRFFTGWFKYTPAIGTDAAVVKTYLLKYNSTASRRDTIAEGVLEIGGTTSTYSQFIIPLTFLDFNTQPDTCLIILQSSRGLNDPNMLEGSEFVVDSIGFSGFVGINELGNELRSVNVFPKPASDVLNVTVDKVKDVNISYSILDMNGRILRSSSMQTESAKIDVSDLSAGKYFIKLTGDKKKDLFTSPFTIVR